MIDQSTESNLVDSHHLVFRAWLSRFGIGKEVYYTKCLIKGHPCLVVFDYGSENNVLSQSLVEKLQLPATFHLDQAWIKFSTWQCVKEVLCDCHDHTVSIQSRSSTTVMADHCWSKTSPWHNTTKHPHDRSLLAED